MNLTAQPPPEEKPVTILIVEDNQVLREGLRDILAFEGYRVIAAGNGLEALRQMDVERPDLILSDIAMPEMDGFAYFEEVRARPEWITIPFVFLTARGEKDEILAGKNLGAEEYLVKPVTAEELIGAVRTRLARSQQVGMAQLQQAYVASLAALATAIDSRDPFTRGHLQRVIAYSQLMAVRLGWQGRALDHLRFGAILHDIGKLMIRETILLKPGPLDDSEWLEIQRHPELGAEMIRDIPYLASVVPLIRHHHEAWDGSGYPDRLVGETIPLSARLLALADTFDIMLSDRPYRKALSLQSALEEVVRGSGSAFDPHMVQIFLACWQAGQIQQVWNRCSDDAGPQR